MKGLGADEEILIEVLTTRSNKRLHAISNVYPKCKDLSLLSSHHLFSLHSVRSNTGTGRAQRYEWSFETNADRIGTESTAGIERGQ